MNKSTIDASSNRHAISGVVSKLIDLGNGIFRKRHTEIGASPGTLAIPDDALAPRVRMISYDNDQLMEEEIDNVQQLQAAFATDNVTWVDVQGFGDKQLLQEIGEVFSIHPLAMEDIVNMPQRPKSESYDSRWLLSGDRVPGRPSGTTGRRSHRASLGRDLADPQSHQEHVGKPASSDLADEGGG